MSVSPARAAAFDVLLRIERERAFSSVLLSEYEERLAPADRGLCHEIVLGALRSQLTLDCHIDAFSKGKRLDIEVRVAARIGLFQLLSLDRVPPRAAINESVELVKRARKTSAAGFVNALLRGATREARAVAASSETERIAVETSHPGWLVDRWVSQLGLRSASELANANNVPSKTAFRVLDPRDADVLELIANSVASTDVPGCYQVPRSTPLLRKLASENKIYLQDEGSQMVAHAVKVPRQGKFLDVCAAPGGKTGLVSSVNELSLAVAGDISARRVDLLRETCRRQGADVKIARYDAAAGLPFADAAFDAVLVDAPCSGTGTIRHNPEIRYFLTQKDIENASSKQRRILAEASKVVKKGGLLVYSTCSLEREEDESNADWFGESFSEYDKVRPAVPERFVTRDGYARTWPHRDDMDGFFIAAFQRR